MILTAHKAYRKFHKSGPAQVVYGNATSASWPLPIQIGSTTPTAFLCVNNSSLDARIAFGSDATIHVGPNGVSIIIPAGRAVLFDESEPTSLATFVGVVGSGTKLTIYPGTTAKMVVFEDFGATPDPDDVINGSGGAYTFTGSTTTVVGLNNITAPIIGTGTPS